MERKALLAIGLVLFGCTSQTLIVSTDAGPSIPDGAGIDAGRDAGPTLEPVGGSECDQQDDCAACFQCVQGPHQACIDAALQCDASSECIALVDCLRVCADGECARACGAEHPSATSILVSFYQCAYCDACPADCRDTASTWCDAPPF